MKKDQQIFYLVLLFFTALGLSIAMMFVGGWIGHAYKFGANFLLGLGLVWAVYKYFPPPPARWIPLSLISPFSLVVLMYGLFWFFKGDNILYVGIASSLSFFIGGWVGYILYAHPRYKRVIWAASIVFNLMVMYPVMSALGHKQNFGTFTGNVNLSFPKNYYALGSSGLVYRFNEPGVYYVLDFWTLQCAACFRAFPKVDAFYRKIKNRGDVKLNSINVKLQKETKDDALQAIRRRGFSFPILFDSMINIEKGTSPLPVRAYPTVLIVKDEKIIHIGDIESAEKQLISLLAL